MTDFPRSPRLIKGALALLEKDQATSDARLVVFQYNPDQVRRSLANRTPQAPAGGANQGAREDVLRVAGPPVETINLSIVLNTADQLAAPEANSDVAKDGLHPALAALELMMYPPSLDSEDLERRAKSGDVQVKPAALPLALLIWGRARVVPVTITSFSVTEEAFDPRLNPIRAKVDLGLKVLTSLEFPDSSVGRDAYIAYQKQKEQMGASFLGTVDEGHLRSFLPKGA